MFILSLNRKIVSQLISVEIERIEFSKGEVDGSVKVNDRVFGTYPIQRAVEVFEEIVDASKMNKSFYQLPKE